METAFFRSGVLGNRAAQSRYLKENVILDSFIYKYSELD